MSDFIIDIVGSPSLGGGSGGGGASSLGELTDVDASAPSTNQLLAYNGSVWSPVNGVLHGGSATVTIPRLASDADARPTSPDAADDEFDGASLGESWSWVNQGSATATVASSHVLLTVPSITTGNVRGIFRSYPGTSTWIAKVSGWSSNASWTGSNNYEFGMARRDSATGRLELYTLLWSSLATMQYVNCERWTNPTTYSFALAAISLIRSTYSTMYLKLVDDGTNVYFSWSLDGLNYTVLVSYARAAFLANADQIGLVVFTQQNGGNIYLQSDWMRRIA